MINTKKSPIAFAEVYDIIKHSSKEIQEKIPNNFINFLKNNMDTEQEINIDYSQGIDKQNIQHETKIILGIIYRDFLCDSETKKIQIAKEKKELAEIEIQKRDQYNPENIFKKSDKINIVQEEKHENMALIEYKPERWYNKIWAKIKSIFK